MMALKNAAIVFNADHNKIDGIIQSIVDTFEIQLIHCQTSYEKLWITREEPEEADNGKNQE